MAYDVTVAQTTVATQAAQHALRLSPACLKLYFSTKITTRNMACDVITTQSEK